MQNWPKISHYLDNRLRVPEWCYFCIIHYCNLSNDVSGCFHGSYGQNCMKICKCPDTCDCDPVTGECSSASNHSMLNSTQRCKFDPFKEI